MWPRDVEDVDKELVAVALTIAMIEQDLDACRTKLIELAEERKVLTAV